MASRKKSAAQAKAARQKKIVIVLGVLFVVIAVIQVPKTMKQLHPKPAGMAPPTPGSVAAAAVAATPGAGGPATPGQLHNFSRLRLKDPFHALIQTASPAAAAGSAAAAPAPKAEDAAKAKAAQAKSQAAASGTVTFKAPVAPPNAAIVKTNGRKQTVFIGDGFPNAYPLFKLVAVGEKNVRVGVLGGSFTSGVPTIRLAKGKRVTLANQGDGTRYVIELVRLVAATPPAPKATTSGPPAPAAATTPATTPPPAATPTTPTIPTATP